HDPPKPLPSAARAFPRKLVVIVILIFIEVSLLGRRTPLAEKPFAAKKARLLFLKFLRFLLGLGAYGYFHFLLHFRFVLALHRELYRFFFLFPSGGRRHGLRFADFRRRRFLFFHFLFGRCRASCGNDVRNAVRHAALAAPERGRPFDVAFA